MTALELYEMMIESVSVEQRGTFDKVVLTKDDLEHPDFFIKDEIKEIIIKAHNDFYEKTEENGQYQNNYFYCIEQPLSEINL